MNIYGMCIESALPAFCVCVFSGDTIRSKFAVDHFKVNGDNPLLFDPERRRRPSVLLVRESEVWMSLDSC